VTPYVTAVSGVSGAGKSSLIERTVSLLGDAVALYFDDYAPLSKYPKDLRKWMDEGADVDEWKTPRFSADLARLRAGEAIELPEGGGTVKPARWVLVEEPFAKLRREMDGLIDFAVQIEVPGDVLLARRLLRRMGEEKDHFGDALLDQVRKDLEQHLKAGHELDTLAAVMIRSSADLHLDGRESVDTLAEQLAARLTK
jgi:uridine kinase